MNRARIIGFTLVGVIAAAGLFWLAGPVWSTPGVSPSGLDEKGCSEITSTTPRFLFWPWDQHNPIRTDPLLWSDIRITELGAEFPRGRIMDHRMTGEAEAGDIVCGFSRESQAWYYIPTREKMIYWCSMVEWADCPGRNESPPMPQP